MSVNKGAIFSQDLGGAQSPTPMKHQNLPEVNPPAVFCGLDIAKMTFVAAIDSPSPRASDRARFPNSPAGYAALREWIHARLAPGGTARVAMEATGAYWLPLAMSLKEDSALIVCVHNPAVIKRFIGSFGLRAKTDDIDATLIARFARERARVAWVPASAVRARLCALARAYDDIKVTEGAFRTRSQQAMCPEADAHFRAVLAVIASQLDALRDEMIALVASDPALATQSELLQTIPGIAELSAAQILAELPPELLHDPRAMSAHAGLVPSIEQSGTSINKSKLCRQGNPHLRTRIFQAGSKASRWCPQMRAFRERLIAKGKHKMRALVACSHKLLRVICAMLTSGQAFEPTKLLPVT